LAVDRVQNYRSLLTSNALMERAIATHGLPTTAAGLASHLAVTSPHGTSLINITTTASSGPLAAGYASSIAQEFVSASAELLEKGGTVHARLTGYAPIPTNPDSPHTVQNAIYAALACGLIAVLTTFARAYRDPKLRYLPTPRRVNGLVVAGRLHVPRHAYQAGKRSVHRHTRALEAEIGALVLRLRRRGLMSAETDFRVVCADSRIADLVDEVLRRKMAAAPVDVGQPGTQRTQLASRNQSLVVGVVPASWRWRETVQFIDQLAGADRRVLVIAE
jgi:hypothetical protein